MKCLFAVLYDPTRPNKYIPPGIAYVAGSLRKHTHHNVYGINLCYENFPLDALTASIIRNTIDVLCIGELSSNYPVLKDVVTHVRKTCPEVLIIVGGGIITAEPDIVIDCLDIDYGCIGPGEETICELINCMETGGDISSVNGIVYKNGADIHITAPREAPASIDDIPIPAFELFSLEMFLKEGYGLPIITSRSCTHQCTFCFHPSGSQYKQRSIENIFEEIDYWIKEYNVTEFYLADELVGNTRSHLKELCVQMKKRKVKFSTTLRVDIVTDDLIKELVDAGCTSICYGLESASDRILRSMRKGITLSKIESALRTTKKYPVTMLGSFIFGDPEETMETAQFTLSWWFQNLHYGISIYFITAFPGTKIYTDAVKKGLTKDRVGFLEERCPVINLSQMSDNEFSALKKKVSYLSNLSGDVVGGYNFAINDQYKIMIEATCPLCGTVNIFRNTIYNYARVFHCSQCLSKVNIENFLIEDMAVVIGMNICVWGCTNKSVAFLEYAKLMPHVHIVKIVDENPEFIARDFCGHLVDHPKILEKTSFDRLYIGMVDDRQDIVNKVRKELHLKQEIIPF